MGGPDWGWTTEEVHGGFGRETREDDRDDPWRGSARIRGRTSQGLHEAVIAR